MIRVTNILGDDMFGLWHVKRIIVTKVRQHFALSAEEERFSTRDDAEQHARARAQRFLHRTPGLMNGDVMWDAVPS
jgi:hypothetical protein